MKKLLALLLTAALVCGLCVPAFAAPAHSEQAEQPASSPASVQTASAETNAESSALPVVFVTGIGQTWTHLVDENGNYKTETNKKGETKPILYNLFYADTQALKQPRSIVNITALAVQLLATVFLNRNMLSEYSLKRLVSTILSRHILDADGNLPSDVEDCARNFPLSAYNETDRYNFFRSIPCQSVLDGMREEDIYCYYHSAFSYLERDADGLDTFISDVVLPGRDVQQVVLVPMSMGAAVVSAYLAKYADKGQVRRVVSIVGAWNGSDLVADLIEGKYVEDSAQMFYETLLPNMIEEPWGSLAAILMHTVSKATLRSMVESIREAIVETLILPTPSLLALIPAERYPAIEQKYLAGRSKDKIRMQAHEYFEAQRTFPQRVRALQAQGTEFYFLCGYGLPFGSADDEYWYFRFLRSTATTNSDEIIQISSTAPGAEFAPAGASLGRTGAYVSPDGSVDLAASIAPDRTWCFYRQRHQLDYNNTALRLAMEIATGRVTDVQTSAQKYPQFNGERNVKDLLRGDNTLLHQLQAILDAHSGEDLPDVRQSLDECRAMLENTHNDPAADNAVMENARQVIARYNPQPQPQQAEPTLQERMEDGFIDFLKKVLPPIRERLYQRYGTGGRGDRR